jgi:hypothetical protein
VLDAIDRGIPRKEVVEDLWLVDAYPGLQEGRAY